MSVKINSELARLEGSYIFAWVAEEVSCFSAQHKDMSLIHLGIGDVKGPLALPEGEALICAAGGMLKENGFKGYGPAEGYGFLRQAVAESYRRNGAAVKDDGIFICHGAKELLWHISSLFENGFTAAVPCPAYPVYSDILCYKNAAVLPLQFEGDRFPMPPKESFDVAFLCSPNNPTGHCLDDERAACWVDRARELGAVIIFDAAYSAYVRDNSVKSIFQIDGAESCAIEIGSLSKSHFFTGLRCGWAVIPSELKIQDEKLKDRFYRLASSCMNGVSYPVQVAAAAALSQASEQLVKPICDEYLKSAEIIAAALPCDKVFKSVNSPYVWYRCGGSSKQFFKSLLQSHGIICTPGVGFGAEGEGFCRFSGFCGVDTAKKAASIIRNSGLFFS